MHIRRTPIPARFLRALSTRALVLPRVLLAAIAALFTVLASVHPAAAGANNMAKIAPFPADKIKALAPLLRGSDVTVIESDAAGRQQQISVFTLVAAPPELVREVLLSAERYPEFVRNLKTAKVANASASGFDFEFMLSYGLFSIDGRDRYVKLPADAMADAPPVEMYDLNDGEAGTRHYRWEFYRVAGATVLAMYGYTDVLHSTGLVQKLVARVPQLEHGLALVSQLTLVLSMKARAEQLHGSPPLMPPAGSAPYGFLLDRGTVVLLRAQGGRLAETSLIDRSRAPASALLGILKQPSEWPRFVPTVAQVIEQGAREDLSLFELVQSLPLLSFKTRYGARSYGSSVDMLGIAGDLAGARLRFDLSASQPEPAASQPAQANSQLVLRAAQQYDKGSLIIRQLYKLEPLFEYGVNVGLQLLLLRSLKLRAETSPAP